MPAAPVRHRAAAANDGVTPTTDLVAAALRYCAVADWFENHARRWQKHLSEPRAMQIFNEVEAELRRVGGRALRAHRTGSEVLVQAGVPRVAIGGSEAMSTGEARR